MCLLPVFLSSYMTDCQITNYGDGQFTSLEFVPESEMYLFHDPKLSSENDTRIDVEIEHFVSKFIEYMNESNAANLNV